MAVDIARQSFLLLTPSLFIQAQLPLLLSTITVTSIFHFTTVSSSFSSFIRNIGRAPRYPLLYLKIIFSSPLGHHNNLASLILGIASSILILICPAASPSSSVPPLHPLPPIAHRCYYHSLVVLNNVEPAKVK